MLGELICELVEADAGEFSEHDLGHRAKPCQGRPHRTSDDRLLGDRGVPDPVRPKSGLQTLGGLEHPARAPDVIADENNVLIVLALLGQSCRHRRPVGRLVHAQTSLSLVSIAGSSQARARSVASSTARSASSRTSSISSSEASSALMIAPRSTTNGSRSSQDSSSPSGRYVAGSEREWPRWR